MKQILKQYCRNQQKLLVPRIQQNEESKYSFNTIAGKMTTMMMISFFAHWSLHRALCLSWRRKTVITVTFLLWSGLSRWWWWYVIEEYLSVIDYLLEFFLRICGQIFLGNVFGQKLFLILFPEIVCMIFFSEKYGIF